MSHAPQQHRARKRFGQNFLRDLGIISRIVRAIGPREGDRLIEIGPGQGALTEPLLEAAGALEVIELDRDLIPGLRVQFFSYPDFVIHEGDALKFDFTGLKGDGSGLRVVGNLPYNISTPLIVHLLTMGDAIADMHFMLQKEVVERLAAEPGGPDWGRLSVMAQYYCQVEQLFIVPPEAFVPRPSVDSAIVRLTPHATLPHTADDPELLFELVKLAFGQRRKTLRNNLKGRVGADVLEALGIDPVRRPQTLTVAEFVAIANRVAANEGGGHAMSDLAINVTVTPEYRAEESNEAESRFVFSYTVSVHNGSPHSVQLMARYWKITHGSGEHQEVRGKGVVGQQPLIGPGQRFRYTSRAVLQTPVGVMEGVYTLLDTSTQRVFEVTIPTFRLAVPYQLH